MGQDKANAIIYCFSATGNTARGAEIVNRELASRGYDTRICWIGHGQEPIQQAFDLTILAFPVYAWTMPDIVKRFVKALPKGANRKAAVLATWGGGPGPAIGHGVSLMTKMGYHVTHSGGALYPDNWTHVLNPASGQTALNMLSTGEAMMVQYVTDLIEKPSSLYQTPAGANLMLPVSIGFRTIGRRILGLTYYADSECTGCGLCERICPVANISDAKSKHPRWGLACEDCCKCINLCPVNAVNSSNIRIIAAAIILMILTTLAVWNYPAITAITLWLSMPQWLSGLLRLLSTVTVVHILWFALVYYVSNPLALELEKRFGRKLDASYSKAYSRYKHPDYKG